MAKPALPCTSVLLCALLCVLPFVSSVTVPLSNCYAVDQDSYLHDFTPLAGSSVSAYAGTDKWTVNICDDVTLTNSKGSVTSFGRYFAAHQFIPGSYNVPSFQQTLLYGDTVNCSSPTLRKNGRVTKLGLFCNGCPANKDCLDGKSSNGTCICGVKTYNSCSASIDISVPCLTKAPRVLSGFTVGFNPRENQVVTDGLTNVDYSDNSLAYDSSFSTEQHQLSLYFSALASTAHLVAPPVVTVSPSKGLDVSTYGSALSPSSLPTAVSPSLLVLQWRCEKVSSEPYQVKVSVPVKGYSDVNFSFTKKCDFVQPLEKKASWFWAWFGFILFYFNLFLFLAVVGAFIYAVKFQGKRGMEAVLLAGTVSRSVDHMEQYVHKYVPADASAVARSLPSPITNLFKKKGASVSKDFPAAPEVTAAVSSVTPMLTSYTRDLTGTPISGAAAQSGMGNSSAYGTQSGMGAPRGMGNPSGMEFNSNAPNAPSAPVNSYGGAGAGGPTGYSQI